MYPTTAKEGNHISSFQDYVMRAPLRTMKFRPEFTRSDARRRQKEEKDGK